MPNLLLTESCVRHCPYCFAKQYMENESNQNTLTKENVLYVADFLKRSDFSSISLLGGEPLIHPQVSDYIDYLLNMDFYITIFTSGIMPTSKYKSFVDRILGLTEEYNNKLSFVVNVNEPRFSPKSELEKVYKFLSDLGDLCSLSFNIYRLDYNLDFLIEYILKYGLRRRVRFGIANPIPGVANEYIHPKDFKKVGSSLIKALESLYDHGIVPNLDCGFPLCMFDNEGIGKLYKYTNNSLSFHECGPTFDIGPDLSCWSCFPLSNVHKVSLKDFENYEAIYDYFDKIHQEYRKRIRGIYKECDQCRNYNNSICSGGCLAHILNRFHEEGSIRQINI